MRLLLNRGFVSAPIVHPFVAGWETAPEDVPTMAIQGLSGRDVGRDDAAFLSLAEYAWVQETHQIVPDVAIVAGNSGFVAMRCPVRPDGIGITPVRLMDVDGTAEILARATLRAFYGIHASSWDRTDGSAAEVVIVSGALAVQPPEAGFGEDLCRAWRILTDTRAVDHVLTVPRALDREGVTPVVAFLKTLLATGLERRRELRRELAEPLALDRDRLAEIQNAYTFELEPSDQQGARELLTRGLPGSAYPPLSTLAYMPRGQRPVANAEEDPT